MFFPPVVYSGGAFSNYGGLQMRVRCGAICLIALFVAFSDQETCASKQWASAPARNTSPTFAVIMVNRKYSARQGDFVLA